MKLPKWVIRRKGSRFLQFKIAVPEPLRALLGKREIVQPLDTTDPVVAGARALALASEWQTRFQSLRAQNGIVDKRVKRFVDHEARAKELANPLQFEFVEGPLTKRVALAAMGIQPVFTPAEYKAMAGETKETPKLSQLLKDYFTSRNPALPPKTQREWDRAFDLLIQSAGDIPVGELTLEQMDTFRDQLGRLPRHRTKEDDELGLAELAKREGVQVITPATARKLLNCVGTVLEWAQKSKRYIDRNLIRDIELPREGRRERSKTKRRGFTLDEMKQIFSSPLFGSCLNQTEVWTIGNVQVRDHRYWLPLIAAYTGARLEELAQLEPQDIRQDHTTKIWYFDFNLISKHRTKTLKNDASVRQVPIHSRLIALGFLDYHKEHKDKPQLFPLLTETKDGDLSKLFSKWWARFSDKIKITDPNAVFHSFRHSFKTALRGTTVPDAINDRLTGHTAEGVGASYGDQRRPLEILRDALEQLHYPI